MGDYTYRYHIILIVMAPVTSGFSRQKGPFLSGTLLLGSGYFRMVKKHLYRVVFTVFSEIRGHIALPATHINKADCIPQNRSQTCIGIVRKCN